MTHKHSPAHADNGVLTLQSLGEGVDGAEVDLDGGGVAREHDALARLADGCDCEVGGEEGFDDDEAEVLLV